MSKTILITGATDGIGLVTAKGLAAEGHKLLLHGRSRAKLDAALETVAEFGNGAEGYLADFADLADVDRMAAEVSAKHDRIDVLINNAGVLKTGNPRTPDGYDVRFVVNMFAPYRLTEKLMPLMNGDSRIVNLSSAAQAPVSLAALAGDVQLDDMGAYAQSKLAITMWSKWLAEKQPGGPVVIAVNPGSLLASKMVKEGFGVPGHDLGKGADILRRASLDECFAGASGRYFDNDIGEFGAPHSDAFDAAKVDAVVAAVEATVADIVG